MTETRGVSRAEGGLSLKLASLFGRKAMKEMTGADVEAGPRPIETCAHAPALLRGHGAGVVVTYAGISA